MVADRDRLTRHADRSDKDREVMMHRGNDARKPYNIYHQRKYVHLSEIDRNDTRNTQLSIHIKVEVNAKEMGIDRTAYDLKYLMGLVLSPSTPDPLSLNYTIPRIYSVL